VQAAMALSVLLSQVAYAYRLNDVQLFHRCYAQITQRFLPADHPQLQQVMRGVSSPVDACLLILKKAQLTGRSQFYRMSVDDGESRAVLNNFYELHASWLRVRNWDVRGQAWVNEAMSDLFEPTSHALFFTKALFDPQESFSSVVLSDDFYVPLREVYDPTHASITRAPKEYYAEAGGNFRFASKGAIVGIENLKGETFRTSRGDFLWGRSFGGGMVGTHIYITMNAQPRSLRDLPLDGIRVNRLWAQSLYNDLFCRNLPAVRMEDATPFEAVDSEATFRLSAGCVRCHASMDRTAGLIRNIEFQNIGSLYPPALLGVFALPKPITQPPESAWTLKADEDYSSRPPTGAFYMRDYKGDLISYQASDLRDLGRYLSTLDDLYICAASRYYKFFTGIDVDVGDPQRLNMTARQAKHREFVVKLGLELKASQDSMKLIESILQSPLYRLADFGISAAP
jgi:hypothetical protein